MLQLIGDRVRERRLGSDARAGRRVRAGIRRAQWEFVHRNVRYLTTGLALGAIVTALAAWLAPNDFLSGSAVGAGTVFTLGGLAYAVTMLTGTGSRSMGAVAETWTSSELRPLRRHGWKLLDHVSYRYGDVDHVLLGPAGLVVVETKWSSEAWVLDAPDARLTRALRQVRQNSHDIRLAVTELRHREAGVRSALFLWSSAQTTRARPAGPVRIGDVDVIIGGAAVTAWRLELSAATPLLDAGEIDGIWGRLRAQAARTDQREATDPPPPTLAWLYWNASASLVAALLSVLAVGSAISWTGRAWSGYATAAVELVTGVAARRTALLRLPALGWLTGCVVITVALLAMQLLT